MKVIKIHKYYTPFGVIEFFPINNVPQYNYKVYVDGVHKHWLDETRKPSVKMAIFYAKINAAEKEGIDKYYYVDSKEEPTVK